MMRMTMTLRLGLSLALLFHTVRHLLPGQLVAQGAHRIRTVVERPQGFSKRNIPAVPGCRWNPRGDFLAPGPQGLTEADLLAGRFRFLHQTHELGWPPSWRTRGVSRLWE